MAHVYKNSLSRLNRWDCLLSYEYRPFPEGCFSGFTDEFFPAAGASDGNFALSTGDTDALAAFWTFIIPVLPVLEPVEEQPEAPIFFVALVGVPGEGPEQRPDEQGVGQHRQQQHHHGKANERSDQAHQHAGAQNDHVEFVRAVPAGHEIAEGGPDAAEKLTEPCGKVIHKRPLDGSKMFDKHIILLFFPFATGEGHCLRIV